MTGASASDAFSCGGDRLAPKLRKVKAVYLPVAPYHEIVVNTQKEGISRSRLYRSP